MTDTAREVLQRWEIRKSKKQKEDFRAWLCEQLAVAGYQARAEKERGLWESNNVVVGDPDKAKLLLTAHYDTCAVLPFPNFITPRSLFWYLVYQVLIVVVFFAAVFAVTFLSILGLGFVLPDIDSAAAIGAVLGYVALIFGIWWMLDGKANRHTANDNTSGVVTLLEIALALPQELRDEVCFVWFDNEERGLLGSGVFAKRHKEAKKNALVINFDCVGDGDSIQLFPGKKIKKTDTIRFLREAYGSTAEKAVEVVESFGFYPSDQAAFTRGVGVCALKKSKFFGWYMDRIHTKRDTVLDEKNIDLLCEGTMRLVQLLAKKEETHAERNFCQRCAGE